MKKAWLLLKASRTMVGENNRIVLIIFTIFVWILAAVSTAIVTTALMMHKQDPASQANLGRTLLQPTLMVIGYGIARSVYTGFTEVKKESGKSNFKILAIQLPVTKKDILKAQFIDLLQCTLPALSVIVYMILITQFFGEHKVLDVYIGVFVVTLSILFLVVCFEKGFFTCFFINNRIRELYYVGACLLAAWVIFIPDEILNKIKVILTLTHPAESEKSIYYIIQGLSLLGGLWGIVCLLLIGIMGYYLCCYMPNNIYRFREGRK